MVTFPGITTINIDKFIINYEDLKSINILLPSPNPNNLKSSPRIKNIQKFAFKIFKPVYKF
jgi:hypothetical protein